MSSTNQFQEYDVQKEENNKQQTVQKLRTQRK
jgi:hypothetical protein